MNNRKHKVSFILFNLFLLCLMTLSFSACSHGANGNNNGYAITYRSSHGATPATVYVEKNTILSERYLPQLELKGEEKNYLDLTFGEWQLNGVPVKAEDGYKVQSDIVLNAVWMVTLEYIVDDTVSSIEGYEWEDKSNMILTKKKIPENSYLTDSFLMELTDCKDNSGNIHEFKGWMLKSNLQKASTDVRVTNSTIKLKAIFDKPFTELVFISKPGKSTEKTITNYVIAQPWGFSLNKFYFELTNDMYNFKGWKLKGTEDSAVLDENYHFDGAENYKYEFEAVWEAKKVTLTMYPNNSDDSSANPSSAKIAFGVEAIIPDMASANSWKYQNPDYPSKIYSFGGWTLTPYKPDSSDAEIVYCNKDTVIMKDNISLYAYWVTDRLLPVDCSYPSGNIAPNKKIELTTKNTEEVDIFYTIDGREPTENSILYDSEIGIVLPNVNQLQKIKARAYPKDTKSNKIASAVSSFGFTVVWGLTLDKNAPEGSVVEGDELTLQIPFGTSYDIPDDIYSCRGYNLIGFAKKQDATIPDYKLDSELQFKKESTTLYAVWNKIYYTVSYSIGNAGNYAPETINVPEGYELSAVDLPNITSEFNKFLGWIDSNGTAVTKGYKITSNTILTATWEEIKCKITYDVGSYPATTPAVREVTYKSSIKNEFLPELAVKNYWFDGWYIDETETYYVTEDGKDVEKSRTVSKKVSEGDFVINNDITLYAKAHRQYNIMDEVKDDDGKLVAYIIKPSTKDSVAIGVGIKDYFLPFMYYSAGNNTEYYISSKTSDAQKYFLETYMPEIIAYQDLSGDQDGSDNFDIILDYMKANGIKDSNGNDAWTVDQRLYDEARAFYNAVHYASNEDTGTVDDRTDVYCETYTKYNDNWYIPSIYEISLFYDVAKKNDLFTKLKAAGKGFNGGDFVNGAYNIASSNLAPYNGTTVGTGLYGFVCMVNYKISNGNTEIFYNYKCKPTPEYQDHYNRYATLFIYMRKFED